MALPKMTRIQQQFEVPVLDDLPAADSCRVRSD